MKKQGRKADDITAMCAQPAGEPVGALRNFNIEPDPGHTAKKARRGCLAGTGFAERRNQTEINSWHVFIARDEAVPCLPRILYVANILGASKVVATSARNHQYRNLQPDQLGQVPMYGAVSAENQDRVSISG